VPRTYRNRFLSIIGPHRYQRIGAPLPRELCIKRAGRRDPESVGALETLRPRCDLSHIQPYFLGERPNSKGDSELGLWLTVTVKRVAARSRIAARTLGGCGLQPVYRHDRYSDFRRRSVTWKRVR
jgi:hypothetical protein